MGPIARRLAILLAIVLLSAEARGEDSPSWDPGRVRADLERGLPLVVHVTVALCSNRQIDCGSKVAGRPADLDKNIYWGAIFGARRFLERKRSEFSRIEVHPVDDVLLERAVYRRKVPAARWKLARGGEVEEIVVLDAVHGERIDRAVLGFWGNATRGAEVVIHDQGKDRKLRVHVAGYVGHNRLMDGLALPSATPSDRASASFVLACYSEQYFGDALRHAGSKPLVMTRQLMAPEGYVLDAVLRGLGDGLSTKKIRERTVAAYAKWSGLRPGVAATLFAR